MEEIFGSDEGAAASEKAWYQSDLVKMCFGFGAGFFVMLFAVFWLFFRRYCQRCPDLPNFQLFNRYDWLKVLNTSTLGLSVR